jgi:hypothetical protein
MAIDTKATPHRTDGGTDVLHCVTQDPDEAAVAGPAYLAVCDDTPVDVIASRYCPPEECGGHPICAPCLTLARANGLVS